MKKDPLQIVVRVQSDGFKAYLDSNPAVWGHGKTSAEAIGSMIVAHSEQFGIQPIKLPKPCDGCGQTVSAFDWKYHERKCSKLKALVKTAAQLPPPSPEYIALEERLMAGLPIKDI